MKLAALALLLLFGPAATHADTAPPKLTPIKATFVQKAFATTYTASATDADGDKLTQTWTLTPPAKDPQCKTFTQKSPTQAIWQHGDFNHCNHAVMGPRGHTGVVHYTVADGTWVCTESYAGTITGTGGAAACLKGKPAPKGYMCSGQQAKLFDNSNGFGVSNGGKQPSFDTKGKAYCLVSITTYHWNNALGAKPGTIGLQTAAGTLGPYPATGSSGQGGAPNVNWTVNFSTTKPVVINGTYSCADSDAATWSQNQQSGGNGFCIVYAVPAVGSGPVTQPTKPKAAGYTCNGAQMKLFDDSNGFGVNNGGKSPSFSTKGGAYCVNSVTTYHWNNAKGAKPGTIGLGTSGGVLGPYKATGSSGQGGAPNVNWTVNFSTTTKPVVIKGTYTCVDSDPKTWSSNQQSGGNGFCIVYATPATGSGPVTQPTKKTPAKPKPTTTKKSTTTKKTTTTPKAKKSSKLGIKAAPDSGKPPLAVTFTLSSPKVLQWRVDFGDGQSKVAIGQPPATLKHTYARMGDYRPKLTVLDATGKATSVSTSVSVATAPLISLAAQPASGNPPLKVTFTLGTTVQNITTWTLDFGDGQHTGGGGKPPASVAHTYTKAGSYKATFSVKPGAYALVFTVAQVTVGGGTPPVLSLTASPTSGAAPLHVTFTLGTNIPGTIVSWVLVFGDGFRQQGSGKPPATVSHAYAKKGQYAAFLTVAQQQQYGGVQYTVPRGGLVITVR